MCGKCKTGHHSQCYSLTCLCPKCEAKANNSTVSKIQNSRNEGSECAENPSTFTSGGSKVGTRGNTRVASTGAPQAPGIVKGDH